MKAGKARIAVPKGTERKLLIESGHKCNVTNCNESHTLEIHHINGDPSDNKEENLIVFCRNHHAMAESGKIDRRACQSYKERLKQIRPEETLKEKVEREGIDVIPENPFVKFVMDIGRKYMTWRYGEPTASIKREIALLIILTGLCFVPFFYIMWVLKAQITVEWIYISTAFLILGAILILVLGVAIYRRCDNCHGYFGIERVDSKEVSRKVVRTRLETRITPIYRNTYRCFYCGNTYPKNERGETQIISEEDE